MYIDNPQLFSGSLSGSIILDQAFLEDNLIPNTDATIDLGSPSQRYRAIHVQSITSSIHTSSIDNFPTEVSRSAAAAGFGAGGGGGSYTLTNTDIAGLGVGIVSSSDQTVANLPDGTVSSSAQISASAAAAGFGSGGGGSYTLTNTDIQGLGVGIVSSSGDIVDLGAEIVSGSGYISSSISGQVITFNQSDGTTESVTVPSSGGGGGTPATASHWVFNPKVTVTLLSSSTENVIINAELESDMESGVTWKRVGSDIEISSSYPHNLNPGTDFVVIRNMGDNQLLYCPVENSSSNYYFTVTSASNSGDTEGNYGGWGPAPSIDVTFHSSPGGIDTITFNNPTYSGHSVAVNYIQCSEEMDREEGSTLVRLPVGQNNTLGVGPKDAGTGSDYWFQNIGMITARTPGMAGGFSGLTIVNGLVPAIDTGITLATLHVAAAGANTKFQYTVTGLDAFDEVFWFLNFKGRLV